MKLALYTRKIKAKDRNYISELIDFLKEKKVDTYINEVLKKEVDNNSYVGEFQDYEDIKKIKPDLLISLGGDGTILDTVLLSQGLNLPVLGVNLGRLGFLSSVNKEHSFEAINQFFIQKSNIEKRMLLEVESNIPIFENENIALNDLTFLRANTSSMIEVTLYINGEMLNVYHSDGLIVSTSTGSTGYSLSCGGPILHPSTDNFIITPIAPHNLNVRPIVLPDDAELSFEVKGRTPKYLCTLDSRLTHITSKHVITVRRAKNHFHLYQPNENNFWEALKAKLHWGKPSYL